MNDPFYGVIERDLAEKCSTDSAAVLQRAFQLCDTQRGAVAVGVPEPLQSERTFHVS